MLLERTNSSGFTGYISQTSKGARGLAQFKALGRRVERLA
jgi:hypothetical protein